MLRYYPVAHLLASLASSLNNNELHKRNRKTNRKIAVIVIHYHRFLLLGALHSGLCLTFLEVLDATPLYGISSMIILPINSVINSLLYDDVVAGVLQARFHIISAKIVNSAIYSNVIKHFHSYRSQAKVIEMNQINIRTDANGADSGAGEDKNIRIKNDLEKYIVKDVKKDIDNDLAKDIDKDLGDSENRGRVYRGRNISYVNKVAVGIKTRNRNEETTGMDLQKK